MPCGSCLTYPLTFLAASFILLYTSCIASSTTPRFPYMSIKHMAKKMLHSTPNFTILEWIDLPRSNKLSWPIAAKATLIKWRRICPEIKAGKRHFSKQLVGTTQRVSSYIKSDKGSGDRDIGSKPWWYNLAVELLAIRVVARVHRSSEQVNRSMAIWFWARVGATFGKGPSEVGLWILVFSFI